MARVSTRKLTERLIAETSRPQIRHLRSVFSNKPDPSLHGDKKKRDAMLALQDPKLLAMQHPTINPITGRGFQHQDTMTREEEIKMAIERKRVIAMEAKDLQERARTLADKAMIALETIIESDVSSDTAKMQAINIVLDRAYGRAATPVLNFNQSVDAKLSQLDERSIDDRIKETLSRVERVTERETEETQSKARPINLREYN